MPTIATIAGTIPWIQRAGEIAKALATSQDKMEAAELRMKNADLLDAIAEAKIASTADQDTIRTLNAEIADLKRRRDVKTVRKSGALYLLEDGKEDGPYCVRCWPVDGLLIPVSEVAHQFQSAGKWHCPNCKQYMA
jgi:hypothetical protein